VEQASLTARAIAAKAAALASAIATIALAAALTTFVTACGGGADAGGETTPAASSTQVVAPLVDDEGQAQAAAFRPADAAAWTRNGRYASGAQADQLAWASGDELVDVDVGCCGEDAAERALGMVWALQAAHDTPASRLRVIVRGRNLRLAAAVVNRLLDSGLRDVWLVASSS
jgi:hypothetical protein